MSTIGSLLTVVAILAVIFVPQVLAIYFSAWREAERKEYVSDGR